MDKQTERKNNNTAFAKLSSSRGMTMAEMLVTVAIIIILMGVGFIALINYQRSLAQIERDGYAKELFIAAQNHLTMSKGEGYGLTYDDNEESKTAVFGEKDGNEGVRYLVVNQGKVKKGNGEADINAPAGTGTMMDAMLPFGSIEETVRSSGSYVIRYQPKTGLVMDVFYVTRGDSKFDFDHDLLEEGELARFKSLAVSGDSDDAKAAKRGRRSYGRAVLGWYGGADAYAKPANLFSNPSITVKNEETLTVSVKNGDGNEAVDGSSLKLIITGKLSGGKRAFYLKKGIAGGSDELQDARLSGSSGDYAYVLDDITNEGEHFCELEGDSNKTQLIPGEDIEIKAVAYSRTTFANIAYSETVTENSIFESIADNGDGVKNADGKYTTDPTYSASIGYFRHLENLEEKVSGRPSGANSKIGVTGALQTRDLSWTSKTIYDMKATPAAQVRESHGFRPVSPDDKILYDGLRHSIKDVTIAADESNNAGIFGTTAAQTEIRNLKLINTKASGSANAGTLAGVLYFAKVSNVVAYNVDEGKDGYKTVSVSSSDGNAGGLAGTMIGGSVRYSAAAHVVNGKASAGGLIGSVSTSDGAGTAVTAVIRACYSGGHTDKGTYFEDDGDDAIYNVSSDGYAGGLLGNAGSAKIRYCYSTCSAKGGNDNKDGGFAGTSNGAKIYDCYSTGLVYGDYAFIASGSASLKRDLYYSIVNEDDSNGSKGGYKDPVSWNHNENQIGALDEDADTYDAFVKGEGSWNIAKPYDSTLRDYYKNGDYSRYNLKTVTQLIKDGNKERISNKAGGDRGAYFVNVHYGDWPAPELFIINSSNN